MLKVRRQKINGRLLRKCNTIEHLLFSTRNLVAKEDDVFKMLLSPHEEYNALLDDETDD